MRATTSQTEKSLREHAQEVIEESQRSPKKRKKTQLSFSEGSSSDETSAANSDSNDDASDDATTEDATSVWAARELFLQRRYRNRHENTTGVFGNVSLRHAATNVSLSIYRSSKKSISFYPSGTTKKGNTVCTFTVNRTNSDWWSVTGNVTHIVYHVPRRFY